MRYKQWMNVYKNPCRNFLRNLECLKAAFKANLKGCLEHSERKFERTLLEKGGGILGSKKNLQRIF